MMDRKAKLECVDAMAKVDPEYQKMLTECRAVEKQVLQFLETVSTEENDLMWDFIMLCEAMSSRKLWLACNWLDTKR